MKKISILLTIVLAAACYKAPASLDEWELRQDGASTVYKVEVPTTVAGALNQAGVFGDNVLEGMRYQSIDKSLFDKDWTFTSGFKADKSLHHVLRFESLGYSADIVLNGKKIASRDTTAGPFCVREYDVTPYVRSSNKLEVTVCKAPEQSLNHGWVDWNPRPVDETMGILGPVSLISTPDVRVKDVFVKPIVDPSDLSKATLHVEVTLENLSASAVEGILRGVCEAGSYEMPVSIEASSTKIITSEKEIAKPRIWWSRDMGPSPLYHLNVSFLSKGAVSHSKTVRFGIRSITSEITSEGHRQFILNGRKVLIKSAGWTDDIFMQDTSEKLLEQAEMVADMGLNSIRFENIWGKDDTIYDLCDSLGLMAIVGFSCHWEWEDYCGFPEVGRHGCINGPELEALAVRYFHDQVLRLRNHPAVIGWLSGSDRTPNQGLEEAYMEVYNALEYRPYICSAKGITSPVTGPSGTKMEGPYEYVGPDYWFIDKRFGGAYGFNTETNPGLNMPQEESVLRLLGGEEPWPVGPVWDYHCTASSSHMNNTKILDAAMDGTYGKAEDFQDYIKKAHALDYDATRSMYEAFRCNVPHTTGIVNWMLNSAWPSLYWQLYDWYDVPTAGYYGVKAACEGVQLIYNYGDSKVYIVNDALPPVSGTATMYFYDKDSRLVKEASAVVTALEREPKAVFGPVKGPGFLSLVFAPEHGDKSRNFYCIPAAGGTYDWDKADWWGCPMKSYADLSFVTNLPQAEVSMSAEPAPGGYLVTIKNNSEVIAYQNILKAKRSDGTLLSGPVWEDNFISLRPGESRTVSCTFPVDRKSVSLSLSGWNAAPAVPDSLDRNRSKYATNTFRKDDRYTALDPYETVSVKQPRGSKVKNVIFMIGDGMGPGEVSVGWVANGGALNMTGMPYAGYSNTTCADRLITDSCAGGTALACGEKTKYGYIGLDKDGNPMESTLQWAKSCGWKTGVAVTCRINDATPADFCVHAPSRKDEEGIAAQYVDSNVDFISGGGLHFWTSRTDGRNLVEEMKAKGYTYVDKLEDIAGAEGDKFLGLYGEYDLEPSLDRGPILLESTMKAIQMLDNRKGFFLMVEGSQIDDYAHRNKVGQMCEELFDFDKTVGEVLKWAERDGRTLVIVTADHCTGGLTLLKGSIEEHTVRVNFSTGGHDGIVVPVFAYGPHAADFAGVHQNAEIAQLVRKLIK